MFLEQIWPHIPTPVVSVLVLLEAAIIYFYSSNYLILSLTFIGILTLSFVLGSIKNSRPFHVERLAVIITLAFINVTMLAQNSGEIYEFLHLHTPHDTFVARVVYSIVWSILVIVAVVGYLRNAGQPVTRAWPVLAMITFIAAAIPLEPDSFLMNQSPGIWILRVLLAIILFILVTLGDTTNVTLVLYYYRLKQRQAMTLTNMRRDEQSQQHAAPTANDADIPIARTIIWMPITLWVMFAPKSLLFIAILFILWLSRSIYDRWQRVSSAHYQFMQSQTMFQKVVHFSGLDRILQALEDIENQTFDTVLQYLEHDRDHQKHERRKRRHATNTTTDHTTPNNTNNNNNNTENSKPSRRHSSTSSSKKRQHHNASDGEESSDSTQSDDSGDGNDSDGDHGNNNNNTNLDAERLVIDMLDINRRTSAAAMSGNAHRLGKMATTTSRRNGSDHRRSDTQINKW